MRRKFVEAAEGRKKTAAAHQVVTLFGQLYAVERRLRTCCADERKAERQAHSRPILERIKAWLDAKVAHVLPKGLLGTAIGYALGLWPQLTTFLEDGHIPIDNNVTENAIRPFVAGRLLFPRRPATTPTPPAVALHGGCLANGHDSCSQYFRRKSRAKVK